VRTAAKCAARVTSVCTGSFLLAKAGLLDGRRATTHWAACARLRTLHPAIAVEENAIFVRDGNVWTSAGVTAGMDLALALIAEDLGRDAALKVARRLVLFMMRPGGQSQFSAVLDTQGNDKGRLAEVVAWMRDHPRADLSVPRLAARAKMSERTFARAFRAETGETPARFVDRMRVEAARVLLSQGTQAVEQAAVGAGFGSAERMRRAFHRHLGVSPSDFQARFGARFGGSNEDHRNSHI
jgi:transcriptional regulator GlxA family with amidase domain